jgi:hypothetical protein
MGDLGGKISDYKYIKPIKIGLDDYGH